MNGSNVHLRIYDVNGKMVGEEIQNSLARRKLDSIQWKIPETIGSGLYFYSINVEGNFGTGSFLVE